MKKVYDSQYVKVYLENFKYKNKKIKKFHKVVFNSFAMVILENSKNEILITKEYRRGLKKIIFGFIL